MQPYFCTIIARANFSATNTIKCQNMVQKLNFRQFCVQIHFNFHKFVIYKTDTYKKPEESL
ncbi:MAG: hypothetical protein CMK65_12115 [Pseudoalteromonas sp.]|nr:hypothetical protein [Pseudoalteromonas sp.]